MSRLNLDLQMTFPDGSHLVISTQPSAGGDFSCLWYSARIENDDRITFKVLASIFRLDLPERARICLRLCLPILSERGDGPQKTTLFGLAWTTLVRKLVSNLLV